MTIREEDLQSGIIVRARSAKGNMHREFSIWKRGLAWIRFKSDFGEIAGAKHTVDMLEYLNRYDFEVIGRWEQRLYKKKQLKDPFNISGAL